MASKIKVTQDIYKLARAAAEYFVTLSQEMILEKGYFTAVLSGGSTPENLYSLLATDTYSARVEWDKTYLFWGDERCVPPDALDSNFRLVRDHLLNNISIPAENVFRLHGEMPPEEAAEAYQADLEGFFKAHDLAFPRFDLVFLGLGDDGHTASLFPKTEVLQIEDEWVTAHYVDALHAWRLTLTAPVFNAARNVMFYISGERKAQIVKQVIEGERDPERYPAQLIQPKEGRLIWLMDQPAATLLTVR